MTGNQKIGNEVKFITGTPEEIEKAINGDGDLDKQIVEENMDVLSGKDNIGGVDFAPPSAGHLLLLDSINSPFVTGGSGVSLKDIVTALYILSVGKQAVAPISASYRIERKLLEVFERTSKTPEHMNVYMTHLQRGKKDMEALDNEVVRFAEFLGAIDMQSASDKIFAHLKKCMVGFDMIPKVDTMDGDDKKKDLT
jgi:hypothetical protein